jgi:hypothetical protein
MQLSVCIRLKNAVGPNTESMHRKITALPTYGCTAFIINPFSTEPVLQNNAFFSLAQTWVHSYAITCWTKQAMDANFQLWIDKMAIQFDPKRNNLRSCPTVSCVLNRPKWPSIAGGGGVVVTEWPGSVPCGLANESALDFHGCSTMTRKGQSQSEVQKRPRPPSVKAGVFKSP